MTEWQDGIIVRQDRRTEKEEEEEETEEAEEKEAAVESKDEGSKDRTYFRVW